MCGSSARGESTVSVGASLKAAREDAGLTLAEVAERTRIRQTVVEAMENDDFRLCGGDIYARGHVRSIARVLDVDPEPFVVEFDEAHAFTAPSAAQVFESETTTRRESRGLNWSSVMVAVLVLALGFLGYQVVTGAGGDKHGTGTIAQPDVTPTVTESVSGEPSTSTSSSPVAVLPSDVVTLKITAVSGAVSWIQVTDSKGQVRFTGNLSDGQSKSFRDNKSLSLVAGNAAGVVLVVNGTDVGSPGGPGDVVRLTFRPGDPSGSAG